MSEYISLKELAARMGMDRSHARKYVLKLGYKPAKVRTQDSRNQLTLAVTRSEAERIIQRREQDGFSAQGEKIAPDLHGYFYVIQLIPELAPNRIKLGFAANTSERLAAHRTSSPTAALLKSWPARRTWELTAMDCLTRNCRLIASECFECEDLADLLRRGDELFNLLPEPSIQLPLAACSPLKI